MKPVIIKTMAVLAPVGLVLAAYLLWARPYQLRWGVTHEEEKRPMPGDELNSHPMFLATRAITIEGKPEDIWPWLIQMGYNHAGFYVTASLHHKIHDIRGPLSQVDVERALQEAGLHYTFDGNHYHI